MIGCGIQGCREKPTHVRRGVVVTLPGHPAPLTVGDLHLCTEHERSTRPGGRTKIRDDVIASAMQRQ